MSFINIQYKKPKDELKAEEYNRLLKQGLEDYLKDIVEYIKKHYLSGNPVKKRSGNLKRNTTYRRRGLVGKIWNWKTYYAPYIFNRYDLFGGKRLMTRVKREKAPEFKNYIDQKVRKHAKIR